jgi:hypothetical protein
MSFRGAHRTLFECKAVNCRNLVTCAQDRQQSTRFILLHQAIVSLAVMWRQYCNKPSAKILDKMAVFENCEGRQAMNSGKFQAEAEKCCVCGIWGLWVYQRYMILAVDGRQAGQLWRLESTRSKTKSLKFWEQTRRHPKGKDGILVYFEHW